MSDRMLSLTIETPIPFLIFNIADTEKTKA